MRVTVKGFRQWLEEKSEDEVVGVAQFSYSCPLAMYTKAEGIMIPSVGRVSYSTGARRKNGKPGRGRLSWPLQKFIALTDAECDPGEQCPITAARALKLLAQAEQEPSR